MFSRYLSTKVVSLDETGSQYYTNTVYPDIQVQNGDVYVITTIGDRLDLLAHDFYGDSGLWWIIAIANTLPGDSIYPPIGIQLRLPINSQGIVERFKTVNNVRSGV